MMLSRTGRDRASLSIVARWVRAGGHHGVVWWVRPTGGPHLLLLLLGACLVLHAAHMNQVLPSPGCPPTAIGHHPTAFNALSTTLGFGLSCKADLCCVTACASAVCLRVDWHT